MASTLVPHSDESLKRAGIELYPGEVIWTSCKEAFLPSFLPFREILTKVNEREEKKRVPEVGFFGRLVAITNNIAPPSFLSYYDGNSSANNSTTSSSIGAIPQNTVKPPTSHLSSPVKATATPSISSTNSIETKGENDCISTQPQLIAGIPCTDSTEKLTDQEKPIDLPVENSLSALTLSPSATSSSTETPLSPLGHIPGEAFGELILTNYRVIFVPGQASALLSPSVDLSLGSIMRIDALRLPYPVSKQILSPLSPLSVIRSPSTTSTASSYSTPAGTPSTSSRSLSTSSVTDVSVPISCLRIMCKNHPVGMAGYDLSTSESLMSGYGLVHICVAKDQAWISAIALRIQQLIFHNNPSKVFAFTMRAAAEEEKASPLTPSKTLTTPTISMTLPPMDTTNLETTSIKGMGEDGWRMYDAVADFYRLGMIDEEEVRWFKTRVQESNIADIYLEDPFTAHLPPFSATELQQRRKERNISSHSLSSSQDIDPLGLLMRSSSVNQSSTSPPVAPVAPAAPPRPKTGAAGNNSANAKNSRSTGTTGLFGDEVDDFNENLKYSRLRSGIYEEVDCSTESSPITSNPAVETTRENMNGVCIQDNDITTRSSAELRSSIGMIAVDDNGIVDPLTAARASTTSGSVAPSLPPKPARTGPTNSTPDTLDPLQLMKNMGQNQVAIPATSVVATSPTPATPTSRETAFLSSTSTSASFLSPPPLPSRTSSLSPFSATSHTTQFDVSGAGDVSFSRSPFRLTTLNLTYALCGSYPRVLAVPRPCSDADLTGAAAYRARGRLPVSVFAHPVTRAGLLRCSQPGVGLMGRRSPEDEGIISRVRSVGQPYGSPQRTLSILDCRPWVAAIANTIAGRGYEQQKHYDDATVTFLNIPNIHAMRSAHLQIMTTTSRVPASLSAWARPQLSSQTSMSKDMSFSSHGSVWGENVSGSPPTMPNIAALAAVIRAVESQAVGLTWSAHLATILGASSRVAHELESNRAVVLHCSDNFDRTTQLAMLSEVLTDPHARSMKGFAALLEKQFIRFGHRFAERTGLGVQMSSKPCSVPVLSFLVPVDTQSIGSSSSPVVEDKYEGFSPIFLQALDCVHQLTCQFPTAFQFNERFLTDIYNGLLSCRFGTFLGNCEQDMVSLSLSQRTVALWTDLFSPLNIGKYVNPSFIPYVSGPPGLSRSTTVENNGQQSQSQSPTTNVNANINTPGLGRAYCTNTGRLVPVATPIAMRLWRSVFLAHVTENYEEYL